MSLLLIGLDEDRGSALVRLLLREGDIVGVIEKEPARAQLWRDLGAHVALGSSDDADLVERAAQHARSIVVLEGPDSKPAEILPAVIEGALLVPGETARIIVVVEDRSDEAISVLKDSSFDYVTIRTGRRGRLIKRGPAVDAEDLAEAVSAADDLPGEPRLEVDLTRAEGRRALDLDG